MSVVMQSIFLLDFSGLFTSTENISACASVAHALPGQDVLVNPAGRIVLEPGASFFLPFVRAGLWIVRGPVVRP
jgi:hypothetical protein